MQTSQWIQAAGEISGVVLGLQEGGAESATAGALGNTSIGADGSNPPGGQPAPTGGGMNMLLLFMAPVFIFLIFTSIMSGRREKKKRNELMSSLKKHDKVQTIGGIIGTVVELGAEEVVLRVDDTSKTRIRFSRSAIQQVLRGGGGSGEDRTDKSDEKADASSNGVVEKAAV